MAKKKTNRKGEIKMTNEEIKNTEEVVTEEIEAATSNEGEENVNNETETTEVVVNTDETVIEPEVKEPNPEDPEVKPEELEETKEEGIVDGCSKLNVREAANKTAGVLCVINKGEVVTIDRANSTEDFYKVITNNEIKVEGYCVKDFIKIK